MVNIIDRNGGMKGGVQNPLITPYNGVLTHVLDGKITVFLMYTA